jgi:hypothetical protein
MKTKTKTLILILSLALMAVGIIDIKIKVPPRVSLPQEEIENEELNSSSPITPEYKYHYENDFDLYDYSFDSVFYVGIFDHQTEWSQDPNDDLGLDMWFYNHLFASQLDPFSMSGSLYVVSNNTFKKQNDPTLGAYVDFHVDVDNLGIFNPDYTEVRSLDLIFIIFNATLEPILLPVQLLNIYNEEPQKGRFYIPNFDQYIASDGRVRFQLMANTYGFVSGVGQYGGVNLYLKLEGLRVVQEIMPKQDVPEKRSLILVHGYSYIATPETPENWLTFLLAQEFLEFYENIIVISYYGQFKAIRYSKHANGLWTEHFIYRNEVINQYWLIEDIAFVLAQYIIEDYANISDNVDFICHSMGGLVTRYMIKHYYDNIINAYANIPNNPRVFKIKNIAMMATPNHGGLWSWVDTQAGQMQAGSDFLNLLNAHEDGVPDPDSEIPLLGININWFTYRSGLYKGHLLNTDLRHDGMVDVYSPILNGSTNKGWYQLDHELMRHNDMMRRVIFNDINKPPAIIDHIFEAGTPGIIMKIEDLSLQPNYNTEGKTLFSITLPPADYGVDGYTNSIEMTLQISTYQYQMTLNAGDFEVELPLEDGDYSFFITTDLIGLDGRLYQISGNLKIIDDDAKQPVIQFIPGDLSISDEDSMEGILMSWNISDYSGISEANVLLNGVEIRSYTNQGNITDSYLLPNEPGVYMISVWAQDNDNDPGHDPPGEDRSESSVERTISIYDDDSNPPDIQVTPGDLSISKGEAEGGILVEWEISDYSGISEANVLLNGTEIHYYTNQGTITDSFLLANEPGVYNFTLWAKDNDNDFEGDWLEYSTNISITIYEDETPPPAIPGYNILVLLSIFSVAIVLIHRKKKKS